MLRGPGMQGERKDGERERERERERRETLKHSNGGLDKYSLVCIVRW